MKKIKAKMKGTKARPRLAVFRSNKFIYAQIIDDKVGKTLVAASEREIDKKTEESRPKVEDLRRSLDMPTSSSILDAIGTLDSSRVIGPRSDQKSGSGPKNGKTKTEKAKMVGKLLAKKALKKKIKIVVFDRRGYKYHGRVRALAEGAREGGLEF